MVQKGSKWPTLVFSIIWNPSGPYCTILNKNYFFAPEHLRQTLLCPFGDGKASLSKLQCGPQQMCDPIWLFFYVIYLVSRDDRVLFFDVSHSIWLICVLMGFRGWQTKGVSDCTDIKGANLPCLLKQQNRILLNRSQTSWTCCFNWLSLCYSIQGTTL